MKDKTHKILSKRKEGQTRNVVEEEKDEAKENWVLKFYLHSADAFKIYISCMLIKCEESLQNKTKTSLKVMPEIC